MSALPHIENLLRQVVGLDVASIGSSSVECAVRARMKRRGLKQPEDYAVFLQAADAEVQELIEEIVVPETWFFRDRASFTVLARWVTETWLPAHSQSVLRLLSAPCSSGEEPYSLVMALLDAGVPPERFVVEAVDISARALERAARGVFGRNSFRGQNLEFRDQYFKPIEQGHRLCDHVRRQVQFRQSNLLHPAFSESTSLQDAIFCRNMLIYFDEAAQRRAMTLLGQLLSPDGLLFVGHAEAYIFRCFGFVGAELGTSFVFRKCGVSAPSAPPHNSKHRKTFPPPPARSAKPTLPAPSAARVNGHRAMTPAPLQPPAPRNQTPAPAQTEDELTAARQLADEGRLDDAIKKCSAHLRAHGPSSQAFYLLGLANDATGRSAEAGDFYRKTLYLEPDHYEALVQLALLIERTGDPGTARQLQQRARRVKERSKA